MAQVSFAVVLRNLTLATALGILAAIALPSVSTELTASSGVAYAQTTGIAPCYIGVPCPNRGVSLTQVESSPPTITRSGTFREPYAGTAMIQWTPGTVSWDNQTAFSAAGCASGATGC